MPALVAAGIRPAAMVADRELDSSRWNIVARAWNRARAHWMGLLYALGLQSLLDEACPGKVMRLVASDLAHAHKALRSDVDPDTEVWAALPWPWKVLDGSGICTRQLVEAACAKIGLDPEKSGWTAPRVRGRIAKFRPTPEFLPGVGVANPDLAAALRKIGWSDGRSMDGNT